MSLRASWIVTIIGLLFVELDRFKTINDTYGHEAGDRLLIEAGRQMLAATRQTDTVCRLAGDEFVLLCPSIDGRAVLQDLIGRLEPMRAGTLVGDAVVSVTQSIGSVLVSMHQVRQVKQEPRAR